MDVAFQSQSCQISGDFQMLGLKSYFRNTVFLELFWLAVNDFVIITNNMGQWRSMLKFVISCPH